MYGLMYSVGDSLTVTNDSDQDVLEFVNGAGCSAYLHHVEIRSSYTAGEPVTMRLLRRSTTGSGGSGLTENPLLSINTVTASVAVSKLVTTPGTAGAVLDQLGFEQLGAPFIWFPAPENRIHIPPSGRLAFNLQTAVASSRTWYVKAVWEEK